MPRHKLTKAERIKGLAKLVKSRKVNAGLKGWAKKELAKLRR